jgi:hypothetical protein
MEDACIVETPAMAAEHSEVLSGCVRLARAVLELSQRDVLNVETGPPVAPVSRSRLRVRSRALCCLRSTADRGQPVTRDVFDGVCVPVDCGRDAGRQQDRQHGASAGKKLLCDKWGDSRRLQLSLAESAHCHRRPQDALAESIRALRHVRLPALGSGAPEPRCSLVRQVIGGPAFVSGQLHKGDEILKVDGAECSTVEDLRKGLKGSDLPGSSVVLTVKKLRSVIQETVHATESLAPFPS